ncbi:T9SS type A sorting domain-containing protein [Aquimarina sp. 2304DJ70-9]|uniref:T9SS type A sorting domain-containing protein n=1 Tax=Aquimarina penaris TaxID=3231044 RepID=UPI0034631F24
MKRQIFISFLLVLTTSNVFWGQETAIPDSKFEQALIDLGIDSDGAVNGVVSTEDINDVTDLNIFDKNIVDLTGIEGFESLEVLNCSNNRLTNIDISQNTQLVEFNCASNLLETLDVSLNISLETLNCSDNRLLILDVSQNDLLRNLDFTSNQVSMINTSQNDSLVSLRGSNNRLSNLEIDTNTSLEELICSENQLSGLDIDANTELKTLLCASNHITNLNLSANDSLTFIDVSDNQLSTLEVTSNRLLTNLTVSDNQLTELNLSLNDSLEFLGCSNNQLTLLELENNKKIETLISAFNQLVLLEVSENIELESIDVSFNLISEIDISENDSITSLNCAANQLKTLKINNGNNEELATLNALNNPNLYCIEVDATAMANDQMTWLIDNVASYEEVCEPLTFVPDDNFEQALIDMGYDEAPLDDLVSTARIDTITVLDINNKNIERLTGIEAFIALDSLKCSNNMLSNLNATPLINLEYLDCSSNNLVDLTLKNVPAGVLTFLDATGNPELACIQVDDVTAAENEPDWSIDATSSYDLSCTTNKTFIPDDNFEQALIDLGYDRGSLDNYVVTDSINKIEILNISNRNIFDLTGIEAFVALDSLNCSENKLSLLDISNNLSLKNLSCFSNNLAELNLQVNDSIIKLNCGGNKLANLDLQSNPNLDLVALVCDNNNLAQLDVSDMTNLESLDCSSNNISTTGIGGLNITGTTLKQLFCGKNKFSILDLDPVSSTLEELDCGDNNLSELDISAVTELKKINCSINFLTDIDFSANTNIEELACDSNQITNLIYDTTASYDFFTDLSCNDNLLENIEVDDFVALESLSCASNQLTDLEVSFNQQLNSLNFSNNRVTSIDLIENGQLRSLDCSNNSLGDLVLTGNENLEQLYCANIQLEILDVEVNTALIILSASNNEIENVELVNNTNIEILDLSSNKLTEINDLDQLLNITSFSVASNEITDINLEVNTLLTNIDVSSNQLESLNVQNGNNDQLLRFNAVNNPDLSCIEIDNENEIGDDWQKDERAAYSENCRYEDTFVPDDGFEEALAIYDDIPNDNYVPTANISSLIDLDISGNGITDLTGIEDFAALKSLNCSSNSIGNRLDLRTNTNLTEILCANNQIDSLFVSDNYIIQTLDISSNRFSEINIEVFSDLTSFKCDDNQFTDLDLSTNSKLAEIRCSANQLVTLSVNNGNNSNLLVFNAQDNPDLICIEIDDISIIGASWQKDDTASYAENCYYNQTFIPDDGFEQALINLGLDSGPLDDYVPTAAISSITNLNISGKEISDLTGLQDFTSLVTLNCRNNLITSIDISSNVLVERLLCSGNQLTSIEGTGIASNTVLTLIDVSNNMLTNIDVSANTALTELNCTSNQLTSIDITQNPNIETLLCASNQLITVNINNGFNTILENFDVIDNPNLTCILVDDIAASESYPNWFKDEEAAYKLVCDDDDNDGVPDIEDLCPNTPFGSTVDLFGCAFFTLPSTNFTILTTSENCRSSNNGKVKIEAVEIFNYKATIVGAEVNAEYDFTNDVEIRNLRAGIYELCITIDEKPGYKVCFEVIITEPEDLSVIASVNSSEAKVSLEMYGGLNYTIDFNGLVFSTQDNLVTLNLDKGINTIQIKADEECQGTYEKTIFIANEVLFYPNPFRDNLNMYLGTGYLKNVDLKIYSLLGQLVVSKEYKPLDGLIHVDTSFLESGMYMVSISSESFQSTFKIVKK